MAHEKSPSPLLKTLVPVLLLLVAGGGIAAAVFFGGRKPAGPTVPAGANTPAASSTSANPATPASTTPPPGEQAGAKPASPQPATPADSAATTTAVPPSTGAPGTGAPKLAGLRALEVPRQELTPVGSSKPNAGSATSGASGAAGGTSPGYEMELRFSPVGAGVSELVLANHFEHAGAQQHEVLQRFLKSAASPIADVGITPFAAFAVYINGERVDLALNAADPTKTYWTQLAPGEFEATIVDGEGTPVAKVVRQYRLPVGSYEFTIEQRVENLTAAPLNVKFEQLGPADPPMGPLRYGGDTRRLRFGYMLPAAQDPSRTTLADEFMITHYQLLEGANLSTPLPTWQGKVMWPNDKSIKNNYELVFAGMTSRYFAVTLQRPAQVQNTVAAPSTPPAPPATAAPGPGTPGALGAGAPATPTAGTPDKRLDSIETVERFVVPNGNPAKVDFMTGVMNFALGRQRQPAGYAVLRTLSPAATVEPGKSADFSISVYAGPIDTDTIKNEPAAASIGLRSLVAYTFGGPCAFCTFQTLTHLLLLFLETLRNYLTFDWALAIMLLVVCVRTILHPVTRWSQINMLRFGKQMQRVGPKMKALQEKYKGDTQRLREEMARLHSEEGISYAGALGCLPMFLQTPVWIALSAMLFFAFELRHQPAFFGLFQKINGGNWMFLGDLAEPDSLISFGRSIPIPLLSGFMGPVNSLNILPIIMGVLFYVQQKYMSPPQAPGTMSPEMEQQLKIQKVLMVVMFPVFMYNAPSGLALYFLTNSTLGILESKWIRSHVDKSELERKPTTGRKPGFFQRLQERAAEAQRIRNEQLRLLEKQKGRRG